ncbi:MAG: AI-2E family transporter [Nanoarchaeota archaeon]|nr:AI-2E family transporter [Nanoarchaeota archaeon]
MKFSTLILIIILIFALYLIMPFMQIIIGSLLIAFLIEPLSHRITKIIKNEKISYFILTILSVLLFSFLFYLITRMTIISLIELQSILDSNLIFLNNFISNYGDDLIFQSTPTNFINFIEALFFNTPKTLLDLLLLTFLVFYMLNDSHRLKNWLGRKVLSRKEFELLEKFIKRANYILNNFIWSYLFVALIMGVIIFVCISFLQIGYAVEVATIAMIITFLPVISGWLVPFLLSIYYYFKDDFFKSTIIFIVSVILLFIDHYFDKIFRDEKGIHPIVLIFGLVSGFLSLGIFGFIAGPVLAGLVQAGYEVTFER